MRILPLAILPPLLALSAVLLSALSAPSSSAAPLEREVTTYGTCTRQVQTDRGSIVLTADFVDPDLATAVKKATQAYDRAVAAIQKLGLADSSLRTVEYAVNEDKEWEGNRTVSKGYRARIGLRVGTSDIRRLGEVTGIASRENIRDVSGISTHLSDEKLRKERELCLKDAGERARESALRLASSVGAALGEVVSLTENASPMPPTGQPLPRIRAAAFGASKLMADAQETPSVQSGEQRVAVSVQAIFTLR